MAQAQRVKFLKTGLKDQPGALLKVLQELHSKKITLKSLWGFSKSGGESEIFVIAKDTDKIKALWSASGMSVVEGTAFFFKGTDKAGALLKSLQVLADAQVNMKDIIAIAVSGKYGSQVWVDPADVEKAAQALDGK